MGIVCSKIGSVSSKKGCVSRHNLVFKEKRKRARKSRGLLPVALLFSRTRDPLLDIIEEIFCFVRSIIIFTGAMVYSNPPNSVLLPRPSPISTRKLDLVLGGQLGQTSSENFPCVELGVVLSRSVVVGDDDFDGRVDGISGSEVREKEREKKKFMGASNGRKNHGDERRR